MNNNPLIIIIGAYGSGKSEYSINLAKQYKDSGSPNVTLVDLDVVNPYFRSRYVRDTFQAQGIQVIAPEFQYGHADLPMISPRIRGAVQDTSQLVILDVGGDPAGCRALARFYDDIVARTYCLQFIINTKRPFTANADEITQMKTTLEATCKIKITEVVCNTNLMHLTDLALITQGIGIIKAFATSQGLLFQTYLVLNDTTQQYPDQIEGISKMNLQYYLAKPWENTVKGNSFC